MRLKIDEKNDVLYFQLDESAIVDSEEIKPGVILDYDANDNVIGIEILGLSKRVPLHMLKSLQFRDCVMGGAACTWPPLLLWQSSCNLPVIYPAPYPRLNRRYKPFTGVTPISCHSYLHRSANKCPHETSSLSICLSRNQE
ncbi:MAG: DUF2283 domain-containing protein [bacterium]